MILKFFLKIILRMVIMLSILLGGGLYLGNLAGGDSNKMLELVKNYVHKKTVMPALPAMANPAGLADLSNLSNMNDLLKLAPQGAAAGMPENPIENAAPAQRILKSDEAQNDQLNPRDNPSEWDYIASKTQKCWFHKRTRKKVCEPIYAVP
jgi:hypothetical protein